MSKNAKHILLLIGLSLSCFISLVIGACAVTYYAYQYRIEPQSYLAGQKIGAVPTQKAIELIATQSSQLSNEPIEVAYSDQLKTLTPTDLGVTINNDQLAAKWSEPKDIWGWTDFNYWQNFFKKKNYQFNYQFESSIVRQKLEEQFGVASNSANANLKFENGQLFVVPGQSGYSVDVAKVDLALKQIVQGNLSQQIILEAGEIGPDITEQMAEQTKQEIEQTLKPIVLRTDDQTYTISITDQYNFFDFKNEGASIEWIPSEAKIKDYLGRAVSRKFDIKMVPKSVKSDTNEVVQEGKDGRSVLTADLAKTISRLASQKTYSNSTIQIPFKPIAFTQKTIYPSFVAGMYEGRYAYLNLAEQNLYLIEGNNNVAVYKVSTGKWSMPTPKGLVYVGNKSSFAFSRTYKVWMPWWSGLAANPDGTGMKMYGIHELPCYNRSCTIRDGLNQLGNAVSHGCIRLGTENAKFFYDWAPIGTPVLIN